MKKWLTTFLLVIGALAFRPTAQAQIDVLALDTSDFDTQIMGALTGVTPLFVSPTDFETVDLMAYDVLYVPSTFTDGLAEVPAQAVLDALNARAADILSFSASGKGIVALTEPVGIGCYTWVPIETSWQKIDGYNAVHVTDTSHPVMAGLTDEGLSNWMASLHTVCDDAGTFTVLANTPDVDDLPVILAGINGNGKIVLTGQDPDFHYYMGSPGQMVDFLQNAIDWVAQPCVPEGPYGDPTCDDGFDNDCDSFTDSDDCDCSYTGCSTAQASTLSSNSLTGSGIFNELILLFIPVGAVIFIRIWSRRR